MVRLNVFDKGGTTRAQFGLDLEGLPRLKFYDEDGETIWSAP